MALQPNRKNWKWNKACLEWKAVWAAGPTIYVVSQVPWLHKAVTPYPWDGPLSCPHARITSCTWHFSSVEVLSPLHFVWWRATHQVLGSGFCQLLAVGVGAATDFGCTMHIVSVHILLACLHLHKYTTFIESLSWRQSQVAAGEESQG